MCWTSPNGMTASEATAVTMPIMGAIRNSDATDVVGRNGSLTANLTISASGCMRP